MTDEPALLRAILDRPDDDARRLIYADWLDERGECDRAEFIRVQCALARMPRPRARQTALLLREKELLAGPRPDLWENEVVWFHEGQGTSTWRFLFRPQWRRGFVFRITCAADNCLRHFDAIRRVQPVREVVLTTWPDIELEEVADRFGPDRRARLVGREKWRRVEDLCFSGDQFTELAYLHAEFPGVAFTLP